MSVLPYMEEVGECREPEPQPQAAAAFSDRGQDKLEQKGAARSPVGFEMASTVVMN